ncbi:MAG: ribosome small subunit-dependent GTPase A, partial [Clostridia bacterium]|nr:ribosome small subunit-dependent GTPase A [Clostridia bacterium]
MKEKYISSGRVLKSSGGLFTVRFASGDHPLSGARAECRARGSLKAGGKLLPGDIVEICYGDASFTLNSEGMTVPVDDSAGLPDAAVCAVSERRNCLIRPPMANLDLMIVIIAAARPDPSLPNIDRLLSSAEYYSLKTAIVITKCDLSAESADALFDIYGTKAGYPVFRVSADEEAGVKELSDWVSSELPGHSAAFAGVSGAGKSTLMNRLFPSLGLKSGEVSRKNGRGKQTTRTVELFEIPFGDDVSEEGLVADTPGFSSIDFENFDFLPFEALPDTMREFRSFYDDCRWLDCTHTGEKDCGVAIAVREGKIAPSRHDSYREMYSILMATH